MGGSGSNQNPEEDQPSTSPSQADETAREPQILIVEDSKTDAYLIREALDKEHIQAHLEVVRDGQAATQYFDAVDASAAVCPDLILLDINLPKKSGDEVLKHLQASPRCKHVKVLIVSSSDAMPDRGAEDHLPIVGHFKKPTIYADFMKLGRVVKGVLQAPPGANR